MGLPDGPKSFKIGLVVLIQYRLRQIASHPATQPRCRSYYRDYAQVTRNSAIIDNPRDAFRGQSKSPNMVTFHTMLGIFSC